MDEFVDVFTGFYTLKLLIARACNQASPYTTDPITDVACSMIRAPLEIAVSTQGLIMFKDVPNIVLPFAYMHEYQKTYLYDLVSASSAQHTVVTRSNCICVTFTGESKTYRLDVKHVLVTICACIMNADSVTPVSRRTKLALCNLVLQRIGSAVHISHEVFMFLYEKMHQIFNAESAMTDLNVIGSLNPEEDGGLHVVGSKHKSAAGGKVHCGGKKRSLEQMVVED